VNTYRELLLKLRTMDEKQLVELFHDIDDAQAVERIADCAYHYLENLEGSDIETNSEVKEAREIDDARRFRESKGF